MDPVNVAECDVKAGVSQQADVTVLTKKIDDSQFLDTSFLDLPFEVQCHFFRQISAADIRQLKEVSKELKWLIERSWRPAFYILPPKVQIKILTETQMTSSEIRYMKLVSKDMKYLIERGCQHLTKQNVNSLTIYEFVPGAFKLATENMRRKEAVSFGDISRIFAHCHFNSIWINELNITLDFCDQLQYLCENKITCEMLVFNSCNFNDEEILTIVDRLLGATNANNLSMLGYRNENVSFEKEFFRMPSVRKLKELCLTGECDFSDDDLSSTDYKALCLERCHISEYALRRFHEELLDCRREIYAFEVELQDEINVDRLLSALPNIESIAESQWNLRNIRGEIMEIRIENDKYSCDAI